MATSTMVVRPAAGPLTARWLPLAQATTTPPTMPVIKPASGGAPDATAMPRQSGSATRKTTTEAGRSCFRFAR